MNDTFPPPLAKGSRVWSTSGFPHHGPIEGPKVDIPPNIGGTITEIEKPYRTMDSLLFVIRWDTGQVSKHYGNRLICIDDFPTQAEFERAIAFEGPVTQTVGPMGGFRCATFRLSYCGRSQEVEIRDQDLWRDCLLPLASSRGVAFDVIRLPPATQAKRS